MTDWTQPHQVEDVDLAFPARGIELTPTTEVPGEFHDATNPWQRLAWDFMSDADTAPSARMIPADNVDPEKAMRHLRVVLGCYGTKHQDKMAGAAWLLSLWFDVVIWESHGTQHAAGPDEAIAALRTRLAES